MRMERISESIMLEYRTVPLSIPRNAKHGDKAKVWISLFVTKVVTRMNLFVYCKRGGFKNQQAIKACRKGKKRKIVVLRVWVRKCKPKTPNWA